MRDFESRRPGSNPGCPAYAVSVAQLVELSVVVRAVAGSSPVARAFCAKGVCKHKRHLMGCSFVFLAMNLYRH